MINLDKFNDVLKEYKKDFRENHWKFEKFKWEAVKCFQDNWDINAPDFLNMFLKSTEKTGSLLTSMNNFPRLMIKHFAEASPEETRTMFVELFDEAQDLEKRINNFQTKAEEIRLKYGRENWNSDFQSINAISTYLWLRYPDKYYIFKYSECNAIANFLNSEFFPQKGKTIENYFGSKKLYDEICKYLQKDTEMRQILDSCLDDSCYEDKELKTLTIDFGYYISRRFNSKSKRIITTENTRYWWINANPNIWSFSSINDGETIEFSLFNDNSNKRKIFKNFSGVKLDDNVICYESNPVKKIVALGKISREDNGRDIQVRKIKTLANSVDYEKIKDLDNLKSMEFFKNPNGTLFKLTKNEYESILDLINKENMNEKSLEKYSEKEFLKEVFMEEEQYKSLVQLLKHKKNIILQGAPGVGKTYIAKKLVYSIMGEVDKDRIENIQFHQNYSYEDFIMGYRPEGNNFKLKYGVFYNFCEKARRQPEKDFFFIIDEINRGNLSKIFGELLMLMEKDHREESTTLAYTGEKFSVPENIYIIGMMNTTDRSLTNIDYALRRRFSFFDIKPGFNTNNFKEYQKELNNNIFDSLIKKIIELNSEIESDEALGTGFCIGHSYFSNLKNCTTEILKEIVEYDIIPLISEYWFDDKNKLEYWKNALRGVVND